jgi:hypothetical protein
MAMLTRPQPRIDAVRVQSSSDCAWITDYSEAIHVDESSGCLPRGSFPQNRRLANKK